MTSYPPPPGGQPPYGYGYGQPVPGDSGNQGVWALVVGIVSIVAGCCCGFLSIPGGIVAVVLARAERSRLQQWGGPYADTTLSTAAFWVGVAAIIVGTLSFLGTIVSVFLDPTLFS